MVGSEGGRYGLVPVELVVGSALCMLVAGAGSALAGGNPPGNNGTVKLDGMPFEQSQANEPHVGCAFAIDFFGFDQGALTGTATFELQPPTGNDLLLVDSTFIGGDPAGGGTDLDGTLYEDLSAAIAASGATSSRTKDSTSGSPSKRRARSAR